MDNGGIVAHRPALLAVLDSTNFTMQVHKQSLLDQSSAGIYCRSSAGKMACDYRHGVTLLDAPAFNMYLNAVTGAEISYVNITATWYVDPKTKQLRVCLKSLFLRPFQVHFTFLN